MLIKNVNIPNYVFSKMEYLDKEIKLYKKQSKGRYNKQTENYYARFIKIRNARLKGAIKFNYLGTVKTAIKNNKLIENNIPAYSFYYTDIHYFLFLDLYDSKSKLIKYSNTLEKRILYFIKNSSKEELQGWFFINFPINFYLYLANKYGVKRNCVKNFEFNEFFSSLSRYIDENGNNLEMKIAKKLKAKYDELMNFNIC